METFAERMRLTRKQRGLTQKEAAKAAGMNQSQWAQFEQGARNPSVQNLIRICETLDISTDYLLGTQPITPTDHTMTPDIADREERMRKAEEAAWPLVQLELARAIAIYQKFSSPHEAWAILKEEEEELWDEIKIRNPDLNRMRHEAVQVAAMAIRFITDITLQDREAEQ